MLPWKEKPMTDVYTPATVTITRAEYDAITAGLARIADRDDQARLWIDSPNPAIKGLEIAINELIEHLDQRMAGDREATMSMALAMSECFAALESVREGDLDARVSEQTINGSDDLMAQFCRTLNTTIGDIEHQIGTIRAQASAHTAMETLVRQLRTPILRLWDGVLCLPVAGTVDGARSRDMIDALLATIAENRSRYVIIDIAGIEAIDRDTVDHFVKLTRSAALLGAQCVMTGIRPNVAQALVELGADLSSVRTLHTMQDGLRHCLEDMGANPCAPSATPE
jgi:anti-anti-sigma regulatory factor